MLFFWYSFIRFSTNYLVKKTTMERVSYEDALLMHYKKFLQKLEKATSAISKGQRRLPPELIKIGEISVTCLCELLLTHPYFNFSQNIAQLLVYLLNSNYPKVRTRVCDTFQQIFREDKKFELTLFVSGSGGNTLNSLKIISWFFSDRSSSQPSNQIQIEFSPCRGN